ncbi:MAG: hypothetical protein NTX52_04770 [Planctomycetota bacterium]|nr:hypothetical protein [Planctomycetota bacterium]
MNTETFEHEYLNRLSYYTKLKDVASCQLSNAMSRNNTLKIHGLDMRIKSPLSLYQKAQRKNVENPFEQIHDIVGLRVVCCFLSDVEKIRSILKDTFEIVEDDDKTKNTDAKAFGFLGVNFTVKLKNPPKEQMDIKDFQFEIQVRTMSQDTWAVISHALDYKKSEPIRDDLRREFYALSGLLHVADKHFDVLRENSGSRN